MFWDFSAEHLAVLKCEDCFLEFWSSIRWFLNPLFCSLQK